MYTHVYIYIYIYIHIFIYIWCVELWCLLNMATTCTPLHVHLCSSPINQIILQMLSITMLTFIIMLTTTMTYDNTFRANNLRKWVYQPLLRKWVYQAQGYERTGFDGRLVQRFERNHIKPSGATTRSTPGPTLNAMFE